MPHAPLTPAEYWDKYKPYKGEGIQPAPQADRFDWTQYAGYGPGAELLGRPRRALELGPAEGKEAAHLAHQGVEVTGVDFSPVQVERARAWWKDTPGLSFVQGEACAYLASTPAEYDAIYSVWGPCGSRTPRTFSRASSNDWLPAGSSRSRRRNRSPIHTALSTCGARGLRAVSAS